MKNQYISQHWPLMVFAVESFTREKIMYYNPLSNTKESFKIFYIVLICRRGPCMLYYAHGPQNSFWPAQNREKQGFGPSNWEIKLGNYSSMLVNTEKIVEERKTFWLLFPVLHTKMLLDIGIWDKLLA